MEKQKAVRRKLSRQARQEERTAYLCLIPAFIGLIVLTYVPLVAVFIISFFEWKGIASPHFNGIANYVRLFTTDPYFKDSIQVTVIFSVLAVLGSLVYSLIVALLLNRDIPARGFFRAVFYLPYVLPAAAVYIGWSWLYLMYRYAFKSNQIGYACAISFVFFVLIAIFTAILFSTSKRWVYYEGSDAA